MTNDKSPNNELIISNPDRTRKFVYSFVFHPEKDLQQQYGQLNLLIEVDFQLIPLAEDLVWVKKLTQNLINHLETNYYQQPSSSKVDSNFEQLLKLTNQWLKENSDNKVFINLLLAIIKNNDLYFAKTGAISVFLSQQNELTAITDEESNAKKSNKFSNIISGVLEKGDSVIFTTSNLLDYFSKEKIINSLKQSSNIGETIKKALTDLSGEISTGLVLKQYLAPSEEAITNQNLETTNVVSSQPESISQPENIKDPEQPLASAAPPKKLKKSIRKKKSVATAEAAPTEIIQIEVTQNENVEPKIIEPIEENPKQDDSLEKPRSSPTPKLTISPNWDDLPEELKMNNKVTKIDQPKRQSLIIIKKIFKIIKAAVLFFCRITRLNTLFNSLKNKFNNLSYLQKTLIILFIIILTLFIQGILVSSREHFKVQSEEKYISLVKQIQKKQDEISAALIYKDESKISNLLKEINALLTTLPKTNNAQKNMYDILNTEIQTQLSKLYHQENLENPKLLVDTAKIDSKIKIGGLTSLGNQIYFFDLNNNYIYHLDLKTNKASLVNKTSVNVGYLKKLQVLDKDFLIFANNRDSLVTFNVVNNTLAALELNINHSNPEIKDIAIYNGRLYVVDTKNNQIFKYTKTSGGFGKEEKWLTNTQDLQKTISLATDGSIYALLESGQILKFYRGAKQDFKLGDIYPNLNKPTKISTWPDSKYIYLLEPLNQRLIVLNKNGALVKQISSNYFNNLTDFVVSAKEDKAWLLNDKKIYEVSLTSK